ncbi:MAG: aldo/keto reductase [Myxococcales bacterium]|nr:aldo/keto reductase [Myxococcales bacterium]
MTRSKVKRLSFSLSRARARRRVRMSRARARKRVRMRARSIARRSSRQGCSRLAAMRTRRFGRVGFQVSELALGTWGLSGDAYGPAYEDDVGRIVELGVELGITLFDTADVYGDGAMERLLGEKLDAKTTQVVTKLGTLRDESPPAKRFDAETIRVRLEASRERLRREIIDVVLLHCPTAAALRASDGVDFLREEAKSGRIGAWGVSCGTSEVVHAALDRSADVVMIAYNVFHAGDLHRLTDRLASTDTAVLARSVLSHGLLAGHWGPNKQFIEGDQRMGRWTAEGLRYRVAQLQAVRRLVAGEVITLRAAALRFVLSNNLVTSAVLGVRSTTQLRQLVREAGEGPEYFDEETLLRLPEVLANAEIEL